MSDEVRGPLDLDALREAMLDSRGARWYGIPKAVLNRDDALALIEECAASRARIAEMEGQSESLSAMSR